MGDGRAEGSSAIGTEGKLQFHSCLTLMGTGSSSLLNSILSTLLLLDILGLK